MPAEAISFQRTADGDLVITIPGTILDTAASFAAPSGPTFGKPSRSPLARDHEVAKFITDLARPGTMLLREVRAACVERFGEQRAPSMSAIHRFVQAAARGQRRQAIARRRV